MMMTVLGQASDEVFDLLINLVQLAENLCRQFLDGSCSSPFHVDSEGEGFNKDCERLVRDAIGDNSPAMRLPPRVRR